MEVTTTAMTMAIESRGGPGPNPDVKPNVNPTAWAHGLP